MSLYILNVGFTDGEAVVSADSFPEVLVKGQDLMLAEGKDREVVAASLQRRVPAIRDLTLVVETMEMGTLSFVSYLNNVRNRMAPVIPVTRYTEVKEETPTNTVH